MILGKVTRGKVFANIQITGFGNGSSHPPRLCWWFVVVVAKVVAKVVDKVVDKMVDEMVATKVVDKMVAKMVGTKVVDMAIDIVSISTSRVWRLQGDFHHWAPEDL